MSSSNQSLMVTANTFQQRISSMGTHLFPISTNLLHSLQTTLYFLTQWAAGASLDPLLSNNTICYIIVRYNNSCSLPGNLQINACFRCKEGIILFIPHLHHGSVLYIYSGITQRERERERCPYLNQHWDFWCILGWRRYEAEISWNEFIGCWQVEATIRFSLAPPLNQFWVNLPNVIVWTIPWLLECCMTFELLTYYSNPTRLWL